MKTGGPVSVFDCQVNNLKHVVLVDSCCTIQKDHTIRTIF